LFVSDRLSISVEHRPQKTIGIALSSIGDEIFLARPRRGTIYPKANSENFMGLLDGVLGGLVGAGINQMIQQHGGVQGLVNQFEQKGLGGIAQSWVSTGPNQPVSPYQLQHVLGSDNVAQFARKLNVSPEELLNKLSELLPEHVDKMTPGGVIPKG
jgi:uncharacterized protein YidB (DUF937 family)